MERIKAFDRVICRPPLKMSPEKVLKRAATVFEFARHEAEAGNSKYMDVLRNHNARWIFLDVYLVGRGKGVSREEMSEQLGHFWEDKLRPKS